HRSLGEGAIALARRQRPYVAMIGLDEAEGGRGLHPVEQLRLAGAVDLARRSLAPHTLVQPADARDHHLGLAVRAVDRDHRCKAGALEPLDRRLAEAALIPDAAAHARLGELE